MFNAINHYIGWRNWAVFRYNSVFENFFILLLIPLLKKEYNWDFIQHSLLFILFSIFATTYGYLINDYSDRELDRLHGKPNTFAHDSNSKAQFILFSVLLFFILFSIPFWKQPYFVPLTLIWFLITTFYSLPPIRLKERGTLNIVFVVTAQRLLPILILFSAFDFWSFPYVWLIAAYVLFRGFSSDLNHQLEDYHNDLKTGTQTFVVRMGYQKVEKWFYLILQIEKLMLAILLIWLFWDLQFREKLNQYLWWGTIALYFLALMGFVLNRRQWRQNPFVQEQRNLAQFLHHAYPSVGLPMALNVILSIVYWPFVLLLIFQILIRKLYSLEVLTGNFLFIALSKKLKG